MKNVIKRIIAETPKFWKNVQIIGVLLVAVCGSIMSAPLEISEDTNELLKYLITIGGTLTGIGQFAKEDSDEA